MSTCRTSEHRFLFIMKTIRTSFRVFASVLRNSGENRAFAKRCIDGLTVAKFKICETMF
jgi:hypothetical protein